MSQVALKRGSSKQGNARRASMGVNVVKTYQSSPTFLRYGPTTLLSSSLPSNRIMIMRRFEGKLDDKSVVGPYRKKVGDDRYGFTTFTPIDARRAVTCFDGPRVKATWARPVDP